LAANDAGLLEWNIHEGSELGCVLSAFFPTVAVGAPFTIQYLEPVASDAGPDAATTTVTLPVVPAVPSVASHSSAGWLLKPYRYGTFLAMDGKRVADEIDIVAHDVASFRLTTFGLGCPSDFPLFGVPPDAADASCLLPIGNAVKAVVMMRDDAGATLGGATECTFTSSAPDVVQVTGQGIVAHVTALREGDATLIALCAGQLSGVALRVSAAGADAGTGDAQVAPDDAGDGATAEAGEVDAVADAGDGP
jgi:hypothetical protein